MGHASDWDEVRAHLPDSNSTAINIKPATNWQASIESLANSIAPGSILVGYSMGARLALGVAVEIPTKCSGLVFISGNPGLESASERNARANADEEIAARIEQATGDSSLMESFLNDWYQATVFASLPEIIRRQEIQRKLNRAQKTWPALLRTNAVSQQPNYWPRLKDISIPTLIVAGQRDEKYKEITERFQTTASSHHLKTEILPAGGHMVHREQPTKLAALIRDFVKQTQL